MDLPQLILLLAIFLISIVLTVIGVQLIIFLRDARATLKRVDSLLANLEFLSNSFTRASSSLTTLSTGLQSGIQLVSLVSGLLSKHTSKKSTTRSRKS